MRDLHVWFPRHSGVLGRVSGQAKAVGGVSFDVAPGETLGLVGESGCGKTTVGRAILRLIPPTSGSVRFDGSDVLAAKGVQLRELRRQMQIVFQDPAGSLNPRMTICQTITEPMLVHRLCRGAKEARAEAASLLERCGMPADSLDRYPHEFSGGQRQRITIARALALKPRFIVCDEPTSALDVSIQAQVLNLLSDLRDQFKLSYLFISHDMGVISHIADRVAVMQAGRIVENGTREQVLNRPEHTYTRSLLAAVPTLDPARSRWSGVRSAAATTT